MQKYGKLDRLIIAFDKSNKDEIKALLEGDEDNRLLFSIIRRGPFQILDIIKTYELDINIRSTNHETLLMAAIQMGRVDCIKKLLELGADPNLVNRHQETALDMGWHSEEIADLLIKHGGKQNKTIEPIVIFGLACEPRDLSILDNADVTTTDKNGWSFLMLAARRNWLECTQKLLSLGASINQKAWKGQTALIVASDYCNFPIVDELIQQNADLDIQDDNGMTALMHASKNNFSEKIVKQLFEYGADATLKNKENKTARDIAANCGNSKIVKLLSN
jgi:ankyrin repeat protein